MVEVSIPLYTHCIGSFIGVQYALSFTEYQYFSPNHVLRVQWGTRSVPDPYLDVSFHTHTQIRQDALITPYNTCFSTGNIPYETIP